MYLSPPHKYWNNSPEIANCDANVKKKKKRKKRNEKKKKKLKSTKKKKKQQKNETILKTTNMYVFTVFFFCSCNRTYWIFASTLNLGFGENRHIVKIGGIEATSIITTIKPWIIIITAKMTFCRHNYQNQQQQERNLKKTKPELTLIS